VRQEWATGETGTFTYNSATDVETKDILGQQRKYKLSEGDRDNPLADRVHVEKVTEVAVGVWSGAAFGALPSNLTPGAPSVTTQDRVRDFTFGEGVLRSAKLDEVVTTSMQYQRASGAPGLLLQASTNAGGSAPPITRSFVYQTGENATTFLRSVQSNGRAIEVLEAHRNNPEPTANNSQITEQQKFDKHGLPTESMSTGGTDTSSAGSTSKTEYWPEDAPLHARGMPRQIREGEDLVTSFEYPSPNQIRQTDPRGVITTTELDDWDRPISIRTEKPGDGLVAEDRFEYDAAGRVVKQIEKKGSADVTTTFTYDVLGRMTARTEDQLATVGSATTTMVYDLANRKLTTTHASGATTTSEFDSLGRLTRSHLSTGSSPIEHQFAYDLGGNRVFQSDMFTAVAGAFDAHGRMTGLIDSDGVITTTEYDDWSNPTNVKTVADDGAEVVAESSFDYTPTGQLQSAIEKLDAARTRSTSVAWDGGGRVTALATNGRAEKMAFDTAGRLLNHAAGAGDLQSITEAFLRSETKSHSGRLPVETTTSEKNATYSTSTDYNTLGAATSERLGPLHWSATYDQLGNVTQASVPGRTPSQFEVDARGNVTKEILPGGAENKFAYDASGASNAYTDPANEGTSVERDLIGRPVRTSYADGTSEEIEWEGPRVKSVRDRQGRKLSYVYNAKGQVTEVRDGLEALDRFTYDNAGRLISWKTADAEAAWSEFDFDGNPKRTIQRRFKDGSGLTGAVVLEEFTQEHRWNEHGERTLYSMPFYNGFIAAAGWTRWIREGHDAAGNVIS
ncbi:MAG: hypothetical protein ACLGH0_07575, partial [Thermoanaerobaculia bacterium]